MKLYCQGKRTRRVWNHMCETVVCLKLHKVQCDLFWKIAVHEQRRYFLTFTRANVTSFGSESLRKNISKRRGQSAFLTLGCVNAPNFSLLMSQAAFKYTLTQDNTVLVLFRSFVLVA
ncbi:N-succinylglutamate 5-semialdehyde dehydrogenase [Frankliniella fusca]|uniref:N-succinylglutamate 5-semialdehyde dehydrogenase n=1 Tax=Frankliniella fusca TaxID=407009 RepID=A0AAE1H8G4_9NEOP|nr:N-succinylglutamate 5-semialdehyde dehydrogenase [Frankliniella fusca]